jgi:hypothetical protein
MEIPNQIVSVDLNGEDITKWLHMIIKQYYDANHKLQNSNDERSKSPSAKRNRSKSPSAKRNRSKSPSAKRNRSKSPDSPTSKLIDLIESKNLNKMYKSAKAEGVDHHKVLTYIRSQYYRDIFMREILRWYVNTYKPLTQLTESPEYYIHIVMYNTKEYHLLEYLEKISGNIEYLRIFVEAAIHPCVIRRMHILLEKCFILNKKYGNNPIKYEIERVFRSICDHRNFAAKIVALFREYDSRFDVNILSKQQYRDVCRYDATIF